MKWFAVGLGILFLVGTGAFIFLVADFGGTDKDMVVKAAPSPDANYTAEIHEIIAPMHGGHDSLQVRVRSSSDPLGITVYSRIYECTSDYSAYTLRWISVKHLQVSYGPCDSGRWHTPEENDIRRELSTAYGIDITYEDSGYIAHAKP